MSSYTPKIDDVARIVLAAYHGLRPQTDEDRDINKALEQHLHNWLSSDNRKLTNAADYCIGRFVTAELDFRSEGNRGLGRSTEYWPRFGGKYRHVLQSLNTDSIEQLSRAFSDEVLCGYLFSEYLIECVIGRLVPRDEFPDGSEGMFKRWVPTIYYKPPGQPTFDTKFSQENGEAYYDIKKLWGHSTGDVIHALFRQFDIPVDKFAQTLIRQYFDAGIMLRVTEMKRVSDSEYYDAVTAGGYSAVTNRDGK